MENFKLDLSKLTPVAEADRIKGNWSVVADSMSGNTMIRIAQFDYSRYCLYGTIWHFWFAIPPGLPGFPSGELPDEFELKAGEWECTNFYGNFVKISVNSTFRRIKPTLPELTIPSGTREAQIEFLRKEL